MFRPERIAFSAPAAEVRGREQFRSRYRLVKFLGKCSRDVVSGVLEIVGKQLAARSSIEVHFRQWDAASAGQDGLEAIRDICGILRGMGRFGAPLVLFSDLQELHPELWQFVYERPVIRVAWLASELLACAGQNGFEDVCHSSAALKNLREMSEGGLWPHVVLPVSGANVGVLPELVASLLELTRGATIEIVPVSFLPGLKEPGAPPEVTEYVEALLKLYMAPNAPLRLASPLSWVSERMDSEAAMMSSPASAGAEVAVLPDGNLYANEFGVGIDRWHLGNVLTDGENLRWERLDVMPEALIYSKQPERCQQCDWRYRCGGLDASVYLRAEKLEEANGGDGLGPLAELYCAPRKRLFEEMLWGSVEASAQGQSTRLRERIELSDAGIGYMPVATGS
jgi:radical SAM protein with 4Fe4S-binding SPASM domain